MAFDPASLRLPPDTREPLRHHKPDANLGFGDKQDAVEALQKILPKLRDLQDRLNAQRTWSVLIILQAMDAAGKDGIIKHVLAGFNQQSCHVTAFSAPAGDELTHTYLWRCMAATPARGHIGVFNRSYYEEALVPRVHPEYIAYQRIPGACVSDDITTLKSRGSDKSLRNRNPTAHPPPEFWHARLDDINAFERHLVRNGTRVIKFYLHISREEQKRRILQRIEDPARNWKFAASDLRDRRYWRHYEHAYSEVLTLTSTPWAPWHIIPADYKYVARLAVANILRAELESLHPQFPRLDKHGRKVLAKARQVLEAE